MAGFRTVFQPARFRISNSSQTENQGLYPTCNQGETVFSYIRCTDVTVWLLLLKTLIYKTLTGFLTWRTEVIFRAGSILAGLCPSDELTDETVSGSAPFRGGGFTELPIPGYAGRQTIDREE
jgi:hypothetical protein